MSLDKVLPPQLFTAIRHETSNHHIFFTNIKRWDIRVEGLIYRTVINNAVVNPECLFYSGFIWHYKCTSSVFNTFLCIDLTWVDTIHFISLSSNWKNGAVSRIFPKVVWWSLGNKAFLLSFLFIKSCETFGK